MLLDFIQLQIDSKKVEERTRIIPDLESVVKDQAVRALARSEGWRGLGRAEAGLDIA